MGARCSRPIVRCPLYCSSVPRRSCQVTDFDATAVHKGQVLGPEGRLYLPDEARHAVEPGGVYRDRRSQAHLYTVQYDRHLGCKSGRLASLSAGLGRRPRRVREGS